ncbi:MAG: hypothetical protein VKL41_03985, partial [Snowella sp.]|nr:hypothetical protein [Snowella sp.]
PLFSQLLTMNLSQMDFAKYRTYHDRHCPICGHLHPEHDQSRIKQKQGRKAPTSSLEIVHQN